MRLFSVLDLILAISYSIIILIIASNKAKNRVGEIPLYKYYVTGMRIHILGGIALCIVYLFYYEGGDTISYMDTTNALISMIGHRFDLGMSLVFGFFEGEPEPFYYYFDPSKMEMPSYTIFADSKSLAVSRFSVPLAILAFKNYITTSVLLAAISYGGSWNLFVLIARIYPKIEKQLAVAILFIPSVVFWGSGLMKDTFTFSATCWFVVGFYGAFINKEGFVKNFIILILSVYVLVSIKPYILFSLVPGSLIWLSFSKLKAVKSNLLKILITPGIIGLSLLSANFFLRQMSSSMGKFSMDNAIEQATLIQQDLIREEAYGSNSFNIGEYDGSLGGMISKGPIAINAALFRPYLIEAKNPVMLFSALENTYILFLTLSVIMKVGLLNIFKYLKNDPFLVFAFMFTLIFAFMVGFTTANFGAMVRYKIPMMPFFLCFLYICKMHHTKEKME